MSAGSPWVKDVDEAGFRAAVAERSASVPVVVDFWAPWCGPCRVLGPVLERAIAAQEGRVELAKVNTDESPRLAAAFGIQGIPAVKAFRDGRVVGEFVGARPAAFVDQWVAALAPAPGEAALAQAQAALQAGRATEAEAALRALTGDDRVKDRARVLLAGILLDGGRVDEARAQVAAIDPRSAAADALPALERRLSFFAAAAAIGGEESARVALARDAGDLDARYGLAAALAARGAHREALQELLEIVRRDRKFRDGAARLAMLAIFDHLGGEHDLTQEFRRQLQIVL